MMRKVFLFTFIVVAIAFAGLALTAYALGAGLSAVTKPAETDAQYLVRAENGKITVFPDDPDRPQIETEIDTSRLREYDRALLERGIEVEGYENMVGLLEDFSN